MNKLNIGCGEKNKKMRVSFLTFDLFHGRTDTGSSRIRALNLIKYWNEAGIDLGTAEEYRYGEEYDAIIFQKVYFPEFVKEYKGIKILDMCDPDWLNWTYKIKEAMQYCDAITCSILEIAKFVLKMTDKPVAVIPDRVDLSIIKETKKHEGLAEKVIWFGYSSNFEVLHPAIPAILKRGLELIVVSDKSFIPISQFKGIVVTNYPWSKENWMTDLLKGDILINPNNKKGRFRFKSNNKTTQAWALGLPVAEVDTDIDKFMTEEARIKESEEKLIKVRKDYDVKQSVIDLKDFIIEIQNEQK